MIEDLNELQVLIQTNLDYLDLLDASPSEETLVGISTSITSDTLLAENCQYDEYLDYPEEFDSFTIQTCEIVEVMIEKPKLVKVEHPSKT